MQTEPEPPDLYPVPPAVAFRYSKMVEIELRRGDRNRAYAAIEKAFLSAADVVTMDDEALIDEVLQSGSIANRLKAKGVITLGQLSQVTIRELQKKFRFSNQAIDSIQGRLEEIGRRLEG